MHTMQSAFDAALAGVRAQGYKRSVSAEQNCAYHMTTDQGKTLRCGIGHMLTKGTAIKAVGGVTYIMERAGDYAEWVKSFRSELAGLDLEFLAACQRAHDHCLDFDGHSGFELEMQDIAFRFGLSYTKPVAFHGTDTGRMPAGWGSITS